jgi:hypothetical protein
MTDVPTNEGATTPDATTPDATTPDATTPTAPPPTATTPTAPPPTEAAPAASAPTAAAPTAPAPAPTAPAAPSAPPAGGLPVGIGQAVAILGAIAVVVSAFLHWIDITASNGGVTRTLTLDGKDIAVQFLGDYKTTSTDPSILVALIPIAAFAVLGVLVFRSRPVTIVSGVAALALAVLYSFQTHQAFNNISQLAANGVHNIGFWDVIGIAPWVCAAGGALIVVGGLRQRRA